ncbi:protein SENSITIVE TO UV 2 [Typha latifolia]|uniref:protein SENSITIVE TO UV 2 n=1 Tax=Typha latifolia TaxID=4733 RepID=UPI003C3058B9
MSFEGIDEWDENFLDEAIRIELDAISSRNPLASTNPPSSSLAEPSEAVPPRNPSWFTPIPPSGLEPGFFEDAGFGFSPPRELSQRFSEKASLVADREIAGSWVSKNGGLGGALSGDGGGRKDKEVERLKRELGRVSKQLSHLEHECVELKKERTKKDEQLKCAFMQIEVKDEEIRNLRKAKEPFKPDQHDIGFDQVVNRCVNGQNCTGSLGQASVRTSKKCCEKSNEANDPYALKKKDGQAAELSSVSELKRRVIIDNSLSNSSGGTVKETYSFKNNNDRSKYGKAVGIQTDFSWDCCNTPLRNSSLAHISNKLLSIWDSQNNGSTRISISKFLVSCSEDVFALFRCMRQPETSVNSCKDESCFDTSLYDALSRFSAILVKMHNGTAELHALLEALLSLCSVENVLVVDKSLRILHNILHHLLSCKIISNTRNNVLVEQSLTNDVREENIREKNHSVEILNFEEASNEGEISDLMNIRFFHPESASNDQDGWHNDTMPFKSWMSIFQLMRQVALKKLKESICAEALSIMILILLRSNPNSEREKFGLMSVLECVHQFLQKEVGLVLQKQAIHLLFLLLNCPKMLTMFCSGGKDSTDHTGTGGDQNDGLQGAIGSVLEDLSECLARGGTGILDLKLRRRVILLLAYIASYGRSCFEVLLDPVRPHGVNFLELIMQVLASEMDAQITNYAEAQVLCKERNLLIREALILFNRLASHPAYSKTALDVLTSSKSCGSLTIDVANRLPQKRREQRIHTGTNNMQLEAEIVDLARLFRARVFAFLGERNPSG